MEKFIVTPKEDKSVTMTIRIDRALQEEYNDLAAKTNRSRNELISMAYDTPEYGINLSKKNWPQLAEYEIENFIKTIQ